MFSPSIGDSPLSSARRDHAIERGIDAMHDLLEWRPPTEAPKQPATYMARDRIGPRTVARRVLFTGKFWMSDEPVAAWRGVTKTDMVKSPYRQLSHLAQLHDSTLVPAGAQAPVAPKARSFDELSLEPIAKDARDAELSSLQQLSKLELRVEIVRFSKPKADANGVSTGKVLAVSENYSAQAVGRDHVVIHENANLDRQLQAGERVTTAYKDGKATVYDGIAHDINVQASWMPKEQQAYLRMVMFDALSMMDAPQNDDERLMDAMRYALESTANFFGVSESKLRRADIQLVVNEKEAVVPGTEPAPARARKP